MTDLTDSQQRQHGQRVRRALQVRGVVQGVGFRPFVYRLAGEEALSGFIGNDTGGVTIELEGPEANIERFLLRLQGEAPPLARIDAVVWREVALRGETGFRIVSSAVRGHVSTGIPADAATCSDCLRELFDPKDRRYRYPFLNCTNCGPRFTITRRIPYDRPQTSMARFTMCSACQQEYDDPTNRRFHAQPNACWDCGPHLTLVAADGTTIAAKDAVAEVVERLLAGQVMAIKGIGGFHLSVDATNEEAVLRLRQRKRRFGKPLAVMVRDVEAARTLCVLAPEEEALLLTSARPIVLARAQQESGIAPSVAPFVPWLGIFLPYAPLQHLLFADQRVHALVMTSANLSEEPIAIDNEEARARLGKIADAFFMHDREILQRCDDSVAAIVDGAPQLIRRARGYVPLGVPLPLETPPLLAVGGHMKSVIALAKGGIVYQSQHLGDLENIAGLAFFKESLAHLMHTFEVRPEIVAHDMHPAYLSTSWAKEWAAERNIQAIAVQHHHAHVAGCMAEHQIDGAAIGIALDGTGYGVDGHIWGGEVLICELGAFERFAQLEYVPMPGGEVAIREPWRMAFGHLHAAGIDVEDEVFRSRLGVSAQEARLLGRMIERGVNSPLTSSCGRLFDAVAALVLERREVDYEAQAAIELEGVAIDAHACAGYPMSLVDPNEGREESFRIHIGEMWHALMEDLKAGRDPAVIGARFHAAIADGFTLAALRARESRGLNRVVLSGGCMHNRRLAWLMRTKLKKEGFTVFQHRRVSPGDGGLSFGQVAVAAAMLTQKS